jgi:DnaJ family protein C protein 7
MYDVNVRGSDIEKAIELEQDEETVKSYKLKLRKAKVALKRSKRKDLYAILGVRQTATEAEIKTAYRKAALKYHPDKHASKTEAEKSEAEQMFKSVNEAYEVLSNPEKKQRYDSGIEVEDLDNPHAGGYGGGYGGDSDDDDGHGHGHYGGRGGHGGGGIDPNVLFQMFMQQQGGGGGRGGGGFHFG